MGSDVVWSILGFIVALYLIIGLALALYFYFSAPYCSLSEAAMIFFLWPFCIFGVIKKKKEEDCGC
jgi:hypothetical protein